MATPTFANRMITARLSLGLNRHEFGRLLGVTDEVVVNLEKGESAGYKYAVKLADAIIKSIEAGKRAKILMLLATKRNTKPSNTQVNRLAKAVGLKNFKLPLSAPLRAEGSAKKNTGAPVGAAGAISRYSKLRDSLDQDLFNSNWHKVDVSTTARDHGFNYIDLFSGAGGKSQGFKQAGFRKLFSVEIDDDASATIRRNFPESIHFEGPIQNVTEQDLRDAIKDRTVHVICGGPPCQGFSVAGFRDKNDPRNKLFWEFVRIVGIVKPTFVVLENVPGILTLDGGRFYKAIVDSFAEIGYPNMSVRILEAAEHGVPQLRTRAIFVGNRRGLTNPYPLETHTRSNYVSMRSAIEDLEASAPNPSINHEWTRHSKEMEQRIALVAPGASLYPSFRDAWKRQFPDVPCMAVKENHGAPHVHYKLNRVISAREMARLQTFPDSFIFEGRMKRAMWQIGNAVPTLLAERIALALVPSLLSVSKSKRLETSAR